MGMLRAESPRQKPSPVRASLLFGATLLLCWLGRDHANCGGNDARIGGDIHLNTGRHVDQARLESTVVGDGVAVGDVTVGADDNERSQQQRHASAQRGAHAAVRADQVPCADGGRSVREWSCVRQAADERRMWMVFFTLARLGAINASFDVN